MKHLVYFLMISAMAFATAGCSDDLDNSYFIPDYDYSGTSADDSSDDGDDGTSYITPDVVADNNLKVISFNVRVGSSDSGTSHAWDNRKAAVAAILNKENPTVFGVQEALSYQMSYISEQTGYSYVGVGRDDGASSGEFMGIFYHTDYVTLESSGTFWLSATPDTPSKGWDSNYYRTATWAVFTRKSNNQKFFYMNTHLDHQASLARKNSILLICDKLAELNPDGYPALLTADFNSTTSDEIFDPLKKVMQDCRSTAPVTDSYGTYNGWGSSSSVIDHIFYSGLTALEYHTILTIYEQTQYASDHYPISGLFEFPAESDDAAE